MKIQEITKKKTSAKRVGRGGRRGKTSGRGHKGQKARAGRKMRPEMRDIIKRIPKRRGHGKNRARTVNSSAMSYEVVNLNVLESSFEKGEEVSPKTLVSKKLVNRQNGKLPKVKVLSFGNLTKSLVFVDCQFSDKAKEAVKKAGSKIE